MKEQKHIQYYTKRILLTLALLFFLVSCKSTKNVIESGKASEKLSAKQVIRQHQKNDAEFKTLQGRVKIDITQKQIGQKSCYLFGTILR